MRILLALVSVSFLIASSPVRAEEAPAPEPVYNVLIVTNDRGFDRVNFFRMFDEMPNVRYDTAVLMQDMDMLAPGLEKKYDIIISFDYNRSPDVTDEQRANFAKLIESGMPIIIKHHSLCGYRTWPLYREIVGGRYLHEAMEIDGKLHPASGYKYNLDIPIEIVDREHPITRGIENFVIRDEGYSNLYIREGIEVILRTNHPDVTPEVAWINRYGKGIVFAIALGHDRHAFENPNLRRILQQAIEWCVEESRKNRQQ